MTQQNKAEQDASPFGRLSERESAPLYEVVKRHISESILIGELPPGTVLPSENALAADFGVSVGTVRKALSALTTEGMLMRRRKTGTVVTGWAPLHNLSYFFQYFRLHGRDGALLNSETILLDHQTGQASAREAEKLQIDDGAPVIRIRRLRRVKGIPAMHERLVLPAERLPDFPAADDLPPLLYRFLLEKYGVRVAAVREQLIAEMADADDLKWLELGAPHAVMVIDEVSFDQSAVPVIMAHHRFSTDHFMYVNEIR
ncbi:MULTISPECIES: GntR family transcriptional regulator [Rahnella]|jgi:GntR family transcriptional regulator|uniref:GntR family transcriptional regulator n=1 Tax=Rahnella TaxID=34037 RepID=UPI000256B79F|nr:MULTISPECIES: GntR family transcriptional regulator [Rahnella]AFE58676.1 GntR family transcriptional regulator [Rahnella aquatilis HX2]MBU9859904.1 GntR family transcriptional regulator [Rahnella aceris]QBJ07791.1 GntR family transcriptional regulator [Rahnella aquatilis]